MPETVILISPLLCAANKVALKIQHIHYYEARIPFTTSFKHGSADRNVTETVIVEIKDASGFVGFGEGCPRSYVTGETLESAKAFYCTRHDDFLKLETLGELEQFVANRNDEINSNPAAWCAVELALLDVLAKVARQPVEKFLGRYRRQDAYCYSAILGDMAPEKFHALYARYREMGFEDFKVKLSSDLLRDKNKLSCMLDDETTVRADANNLWKNKIDALAQLSGMNMRFSAMEEPIASRDMEELSEFAKAYDCQIILDESFLRAEQIEALSKAPELWIVNARVSKLGGLLRSLSIIDHLVELGIAVNVGAQVGETSLLTRAAILLADAAGENLKAQEGAFGNLLLEKDLFTPILQFGAGGYLANEPLACRDETGFGMVPVISLEDCNYLSVL